eukprot:GSMAST32.ASY1.ANO1.29.1 assembled CDS
MEYNACISSTGVTKYQFIITYFRAIKTKNPNPRKTKRHIPFRDSVLTRLLQDSLGGNTKTFILAMITPSQLNINETISTLKFADRAKRIQMKVKINQIRKLDLASFEKLENENKNLRFILQKLSKNINVEHLDNNLESNLTNDVLRLKEENKKLHKMLDNQSLQYSNPTNPSNTLHCTSDQNQQNQQNDRVCFIFFFSVKKKKKIDFFFWFSYEILYLTNFSNFFLKYFSTIHEEIQILRSALDVMISGCSRFFKLEIEEDDLQQVFTRVVQQVHEIKEKKKKPNPTKNPNPNEKAWISSSRRTSFIAALRNPNPNNTYSTKNVQRSSTAPLPSTFAQNRRSNMVCYYYYYYCTM